jgi:hypothetical protein
MKTKNNWVDYKPTRYPSLGYYRWGACWQLLDRETEQQIGPTYRNRAELLADLDQFAKDRGLTLSN